MTNMYHKFSGFLKVFLPLGIVSIIFSALLLLLAIPSTLDYKSPEFLLFLYGILASVILMICGIVLVIKGNLFWKKIQVDEYGIFLVNRNGTKVATYLWSDIKKLVISSGNGKRYIGVYTDTNVPVQYLHLYGIILAPFYSKKYVTFPANNACIKFIENQLSKYEVSAEYTGLINESGTKPQKASVWPLAIACLVSLFMLLILLLWLML